MPENYEQWLLPILKLVPFAGGTGMLFYCLTKGRIPVRGRTILRKDHPGDYWWTLVLFAIVVVLPSLYLAFS